jgi:hypothetical protein
MTLGSNARRSFEAEDGPRKERPTINRGAVYKFLTKPWEDEGLRASVHEALQRIGGR